MFSKNKVIGQKMLQPAFLRYLNSTIYNKVLHDSLIFSIFFSLFYAKSRGISFLSSCLYSDLDRKKDGIPVPTLFIPPFIHTFIHMLFTGLSELYIDFAMGLLCGARVYYCFTLLKRAYILLLLEQFEETYPQVLYF
jgi:hypothetical protein